MREKLLKLHVAVLMGGLSREREISLRSGKNVLESLSRQGFNAFPIDVGEDFLHRLAKETFDMAFICLHGRYGEDGAIQGLLEMAGIPYTGSGVLASAIAMNKVTTKRILLSEGLPTPSYRALNLNNGVREEICEAEGLLDYPMVIKPVSEGSSIGVSIANNRSQLDEIIRDHAFKFGKLMLEKFIEGREITVGIIGSNSRAKALPILELVPKNPFYDYQAKYTEGLTEFILPARLSPETTQQCSDYALRTHRILGCLGMSRIDMIVDKDDIPYVLEVNTIPGFTETSDLPQQANQASISFDELVFEILKSAYIDHEHKLHPQQRSKNLQYGSGGVSDGLENPPYDVNTLQNH
ncbi:D-alanine--D-alanine ligase [Acidobacteriota bacterium]